MNRRDVFHGVRWKPVTVSTVSSAVVIGSYSAALRLAPGVCVHRASRMPVIFIHSVPPSCLSQRCCHFLIVFLMKVQEKGGQMLLFPH